MESIVTRISVVTLFVKYPSLAPKPLELQEQIIGRSENLPQNNGTASLQGVCMIASSISTNFQI